MPGGLPWRWATPQLPERTWKTAIHCAEAIGDSHLSPLNSRLAEQGLRGAVQHRCPVPVTQVGG